MSRCALCPELLGHARWETAACGCAAHVVCLGSTGICSRCAQEGVTPPPTFLRDGEREALTYLLLAKDPAVTGRWRGFLATGGYGALGLTFFKVARVYSPPELQAVFPAVTFDELRTSGLAFTDLKKGGVWEGHAPLLVERFGLGKQHFSSAADVVALDLPPNALEALSGDESPVDWMLTMGSLHDLPVGTVGYLEALGLRFDHLAGGEGGEFVRRRAWKIESVFWTLDVPSSPESLTMMGLTSASLRTLNPPITFLVEVFSEFSAFLDFAPDFDVAWARRFSLADWEKFPGFDPPPNAGFKFSFRRPKKKPATAPPPPQPPPEKFVDLWS